MSHSRETGIKFTPAENQGFRPSGAIRCTDSCETLHGRRARGSPWLSKISPQSAQGLGMQPQNDKCPLFGTESPRRGELFKRIREFLWAFIQPNYRSLEFQI